MEDKRVSKKRSNVYTKRHLAKKKCLQYETKITINCCYLSTYNSLSRNFNNITMWLNLTFVNISSNMITIVPNAFGKLSLVHLDLSKNYLGTFNSTKWPWIEQNAIRNTLHFLDISNNFLTKLPFNIGRLSVLTSLNVSRNMLKCLPQNIRNIQHLNILDMSYNKLLYLPISMLLLKELEYLYIVMNSFQTQDNELNKQYIEQNNERSNVQVRSLVTLSANIVLHYSIPYDTILPSTLIEFLEKAESCSVCDRVRVDLLCVYEEHSILLADYVKHTSENDTALFERYFCPCEYISISKSYQNLSR